MGYEDRKLYEEAKNNINGNNNIEIYVNNKKIEFNYKYKSTEKGEIFVKFKFNKLLTITSYIFFRCSSLISIDLSSFNRTNIINMTKIFGSCEFL